MQKITYAGGQFVTGTEIAKALVLYAVALGQQNRAATVEIPVRHDGGGRLRFVNFLLGPASQLVTEEVGSDSSDEIRDDDLVARLRTLTAELAPMHPAATDADERDFTSGYDWTDEV
ncbi:MAG TPA: hypothetical protein VFG92_00185 [Agromyces sp.]|nr:hypothetical protein [Agromyces sp.]